jgi:hypothetical protein
MEPLLSDQNRNTATLALTTLLKTGEATDGQWVSLNKTYEL